VPHEPDRVVPLARHAGIKFSVVVEIAGAVVNNRAVTSDPLAPDAGPPPAAAPTRLTFVAGRCAGGDCPTVYQTDRGTLVIQGYAFNAAAGGVSLPAGEQMVEIPVELLADWVRATT
jgi:hypothetical protein